MSLTNTIILGVISSIISTIIITIFSAFFKKAGKFIVDLLGKINKNYSKSIYVNASQNDNNKSNFSTNFIIIWLFFGIVFFFSASIYVKVKIFHNQSIKIVEKFENKTIIKKQNTTNYVQKIKDEIESLNKLSYFIIFYFIFVLLFFISHLTRYYKILYVNSLIILFNQKTTILKPYISEKEYDLLKSDWAQMKSKEDYLKIQIQLNSYFKENHIELLKE